jgi:hypothetical protein
MMRTTPPQSFQRPNRRRLLVVLVIIVALIAAGFAYYYASFPSPPVGTTTIQYSTFTLTPNNGSPGGTITLSGSGYTAGTRDCIAAVTAEPTSLLSGGAVTSCSIDAKNTLTGQFTVALDAPPGSYMVTIAGPFVRQGAISAPFTVIEKPTPTITLSQSTGSGGDNITFTGSGFNPEDTSCIMKFYRMQETIESYSCRITRGIVTGSFTVKMSGNPAGGREAKVTGNLLDTATALFTVVPRVIITPNPAAPGSTMTLSGSNYVIPGDCANPTNWPMLPSSIAVGACIIDTNYLVTATLTVSPSAATPATCTIILTDGIVQASITLTLQSMTVGPSIEPPAMSCRLAAIDGCAALKAEEHRETSDMFGLRD